MLSLNGLRVGKASHKVWCDTKSQLEKRECKIEGSQLWERGDVNFDQEEGDTCAGNKRTV